MNRELVLVTGAAGLVGSRLAQRFRREGFSVRALDVRPFELPDVECLLGNVTDPDEIGRAAAGATVIAHCAALITGDDAEMMRVNAEGTRMLVDASLLAGSRRFLLVSTGAVYPFKDQPVIDESTPFLREGGAFHLSKVQAEEAVWAASARGLPVTVFRPLAILGAHPSSTWSRLLPQRILNGEPIMRGDGSGSLAYVHVDNLVDACSPRCIRRRASGRPTTSSTDRSPGASISTASVAVWESTRWYPAATSSRGEAVIAEQRQSVSSATRRACRTKRP